MVAFFAFLHHVAAFALVAALTAEFVLLRGTLTIENARKIVAADLAFGASATVVLIVGLLRVLYFEKGADYYFHSVPFIAKVSIFVVVGLLSIYPTIEFLSWRKALKQNLLPTVAGNKTRTVRAIVHWELVGVVPIILCAALMARGIGHGA